MMLLKYLKLVCTQLKWVLEFLLYHPFNNLHARQPQESPILITEEDVKIWHPHGEGEEEEEDCAVCLSKIGEGEEVRVLRCDHIFHRDCLDKWVGFRNPTCPLCRYFLDSGLRASRSEGGAVHVLFFKFCSFTKNPDHERDNWWLR